MLYSLNTVTVSNIIQLHKLLVLIYYSLNMRFVNLYPLYNVGIETINQQLQFFPVDLNSYLFCLDIV